MRRSSRLLLLGLVLNDVVVGAELCPAGWEYYAGTDSCFYSSTVEADQTTAMSECHAMGADLPSIDSRAEMSFLVSISLVELSQSVRHPFNCPFSRTTWVGLYQKGKTNLDFTGARDSEWQWHQLSHMQVCTSL